MLRFLAGSALVVLALQATPSSLNAQSRSTVSSPDLQSAISSARSERQATLQGFLLSPRVAEAAQSLGADVSELSAKVATLDDATLTSLADQTRAADLGLAGGERYLLISTTAIIIILLILILVT
jgi:hypothetical protein